MAQAWGSSSVGLRTPESSAVFPLSVSRCVGRQGEEETGNEREKEVRGVLYEYKLLGLQ